jgi:hypothetical protein
MPLDTLSLDRLLIASVLAVLAVAVAFGPEIGRVLARVRNRRIPDVTAETAPLGVEPQES